MSVSKKQATAHTDAELVRLCRAGDERAYDTLVRRHIDGVYELCLRMLGSHADAEEAAQDAMVAAFEKLDSFRGDASFKTWLYRIASNKALDLGRRASVRGRVTVLAAEVEPPADLPGSWTQARSRADPEREVVRHSEADHLWNLVDGLPADYRVVLLLFYRQGFGYQEIAETLGVPRRTVETRLYRARKRLREAWDAEQAGGERA